jgi:hypothetical protein
MVHKTSTFKTFKVVFLLVKTGNGNQQNGRYTGVVCTGNSKYRCLNTKHNLGHNSSSSTFLLQFYLSKKLYMCIGSILGEGIVPKLVGRQGPAGGKNPFLLLF